MSVFTFSEYTFSYPTGAEKSTRLFGEWIQKAFKAEKIFNTIYDGQKSNYLTFVSSLTEEANKLLSYELEELIGFLFSNGINSSEEEFVAKYESEFDFNYESYIQPVTEEYNKIQSYAQTLDLERSEKSQIFHGQWEGGGFGFKGALKGAIQAGILNAVQNGINSISESSQAEKDIKSVSEKINTLYTNEQCKEIMCHAIFECYKNLYYALSKEMLEKGVLTVPLNLNEFEAEKLFSNTMRFSKGNDIIKNLCKCVELYPDKKYLEQIYMKLPKEEDESFQNFISFWNLSFYGLNQEAIESQRLAIEAENARRQEELRIQKEKQEAEVAKQIEISERKQKLSSLHEAVEKKYHEIFDGVKESYTAKIILSSNQERMAKIIDFYKPDADENPILAYDDTIMNSGKKGFLLTDVKIHFTNDAKDNEVTVFALNEIKDISFKKGFISPEIRFNGCSICTASLSSKYGLMLETLLDQVLVLLKVKP